MILIIANAPTTNPGDWDIERRTPEAREREMAVSRALRGICILKRIEFRIKSEGGLRSFDVGVIHLRDQLKRITN